METEYGYDSSIKREYLLIEGIQRALGFKLYDDQIKYILGELNNPRYDNGRGTGKTTAYCIRLALSSGPPLDYRKPELFSDFYYSEFSGDNVRRYCKDFFINEFMKIREKLYTYGFPVRGVYNIKR